MMDNFYQTKCNYKFFGSFFELSVLIIVYWGMIKIIKYYCKNKIL